MLKDIKTLQKWGDALQSLITDGSRHSGRVRLNEVIRIVHEQGLQSGNIRAVVYRLEKAGLAAPISHEKHHIRAYELADAVNLLLAFKLLHESRETGHRITPRRAAEQVKEYREQQGFYAGHDVIGLLADTALRRFERHVMARLLGAVAFKLFKLKDLVSGTIVVLHPMAAGQTLSLDDEPLIADFLKSLTRDPGASKTGLVSQTAEILFVPYVPQVLGKFTRYFARVVDSNVTTERFAVVLACPPGTPDANLPEQSSQVEITDDTLSLLLHAITAGCDDLKREVRRDVSAAFRSSDQSSQSASGSLNDLLKQDILIWVMARFACKLVFNSRQPVFCDIYEAKRAPNTDKVYFEVVASSIGNPQRSSHIGRTLTYGQLVSGYASATGLYLYIAKTEPPFDSFVSEHDDEAKLVFSTPPELSKEPERQRMKRAMSVIAVPIPVEGGGSISDISFTDPQARPSPVMYLFMRQGEAGETNRSKETKEALEVFAPILGELLKRRHDTARTVRLTARPIMRPQFLGTDQLRYEVVKKVQELGQQAQNDALQNLDARLALVILRATPAASEYGQQGAQWLTEQLHALTPQVFLQPWIETLRTLGGKEISTEDIKYGELADKTTLMLIPAWLSKQELDLLRALYPTRLRRLELAFTQRGAEKIGRVDAWIVDEKLSVLRNGVGAARATPRDKTNKEDPAKGFFERARLAAAVIPSIVQTVRDEFEQNGRWKVALDSAREGLHIEKDNPYLLRRAADLGICLGEFDTALKDAKSSLSSDKITIGGYCLEGDAHLGLGELEDALTSYANGNKSDRKHSLPYQSAGYALLTVAKLLNQWVMDDLYKLAEKAEEGDAHTLGSDKVNELLKRGGKIRSICRELATTANAWLHQASVMAPAAEATSSYQKQQVSEQYDLKNSFEISGILGRCQSHLFVSTRAMVNECSSARHRFPKDDLFYRELLWAYMLEAKDKICPRLYLDLSQNLQSIISIFPAKDKDSV